MFLIRLLPLILILFCFSCNNENYICKDNIKEVQYKFIQECISMGNPYFNTETLNIAIRNCTERSKEIFCEKQINCNQ